MPDCGEAYPAWIQDALPRFKYMLPRSRYMVDIGCVVWYIMPNLDDGAAKARGII